MARRKKKRNTLVIRTKKSWISLASRYKTTGKINVKVNINNSTYYKNSATATRTMGQVKKDLVFEIDIYTVLFQVVAS